MALIDVDRHILTELLILSEKMQKASKEFKDHWEDIQDVRIRTEVLVLDQKKADDPELPRLRDRIVRASKVCHTQLLLCDDAMSRQAALLKHLVSLVKEVDTGKGLESNGREHITDY